MPHKDQKYIDALVFGRQCNRFVLKNGGTVEEANEVFQESLLSIILRAKSSDLILEVPFGAFLYVVYKRKWIDWLKKFGRNYNNIIDIADVIELINKIPIQKDEKYIKEIMRGILEECFKKLSEECKKLFKMRFNGMSSKEIALALKITPNNVDQKLYNCRESLRKCTQNHPDFNQI